jgi:CrcB protein
VALGGAIGGLARYGAGELVPWQSPEIPWATLTVNLVGCLAIGVVLVVLTEGPPSSWWVRPFVAVGVLGGFTTFSALAVESVLLVEDGAALTSMLYLLVTVVVGLLAVVAGSTLTRRVVVGRAT